jgi:hypothetical protein
MINIAPARRPALCGLLFTLFAWISGAAVGQTSPVPPVEFPFDVSSAASAIDETIRIVDKRVYFFDLDFHFTGKEDRPKVRQLVGDAARFADGRYAEPGIVAPIHLEVVEILGGVGTRTVYDDTKETEGHYAHDAVSYARTITRIVLAPGLYRVRATTTKNIPALSEATIRFSITYDARFRPIRD